MPSKASPAPAKATPPVVKAPVRYLDAEDAFVARPAGVQGHLGMFWKGIKAPAEDTAELDATFVRVPSDPLPQTWAAIVKPRLEPDAVHEESLYIEDACIVAGQVRERLTSGGHYEGILADPPWERLGADTVVRIFYFIKLSFDLLSC